MSIGFAERKSVTCEVQPFCLSLSRHAEDAGELWWHAPSSTKAIIIQIVLSLPKKLLHPSDHQCWFFRVMWQPESWRLWIAGAELRVKTLASKFRFSSEEESLDYCYKNQSLRALTCRRKQFPRKHFEELSPSIMPKLRPPNEGRNRTLGNSTECSFTRQYLC